MPKKRLRMVTAMEQSTLRAFEKEVNSECADIESSGYHVLSIKVYEDKHDILTAAIVHTL